MDIIDQIIEIRKQISKEIDEIDKKKADLKSCRLKPTDMETLKITSDDAGLPEAIAKKIDYLWKHHHLSADFPMQIISNYFVALHENPDLLNKTSLEVFYKIAKEMTDSFIDTRLDGYKNRRSYYTKMGEKLKRLQVVIENPNSVLDLTTVSSLLDGIDFDELGFDEDEIKEFKRDCKNRIKTKLERKKKELEQDKKEQEQALIEEQEEIIEEAKEIDYEEIFISKINNYDTIKDTFEKNRYLFPDELYKHDIEEIYNFEDLFDYFAFRYPEFDEEDYIATIISILHINNTANNDYDKKRLNSLMDYFSKKFELCLKLREIEEIKREIWTHLKLSDEDAEELAELDSKIADIADNTLSLTEDVDKKLIDIKRRLHSFNKNVIMSNITEDGKLPIQSFILFDYSLDENGNRKTYVTTDLDIDSKQNLIDDTIDMAKIDSNGYEDFSELVDDLIIYTKPKILLDNGFSKKDRIIRPVFYTKGSHEHVNDSMKNASGMIRIRPTLTSYVRFIDERVDFEPHTKKFDQIKTLIETKYHNVSISEDKPFSIFINYLDALKKAKKDNYNLSFTRRRNSKLRDIVKNDNDEFSMDELEFLTEMLDLTMEAYSTLEKMNPSFDFSTIKTIKNRKYN